MDTIIIPVQLDLVQTDQSQRINVAISEIAERTFAQVEVNGVKMTEAHVEEFVRRNIGILFQDKEDLLIVGQQVVNTEGGRSDLVALDGEGRIVLIEVKRDAKDMKGRTEAFEFQAIRYAANYALIRRTDELVNKLFAPYIERHKTTEFHDRFERGLTAEQIAQESLQEFLRRNQIAEDADFNRSQRIVLIASDFDPQTQSACAWLAKNSVDIQCLRITPLLYEKQYFFAIEKLIPPRALEEFFVEVASPSDTGRRQVATSPKVSREQLPKMRQLLEWGKIKAGDQVRINGYPSEFAEVVDARNVKYQGRILSFNDWGMTVTGWSAINVYKWVYKDNQSLDDLRRENLE